MFTVRPATIADAARLGELREAMFRELGRHPDPSAPSFRDRATEAGVRTRDGRDAARKVETTHLQRSTFMGTQATSLYSWFSPPIAQMKL